MTIAYFILAHDRARISAAEHCHSLPCGTVVRFSEPTRSLEQNARLWAMLSDIAEQVEWSVDGHMQRLDASDWKHILSAGVTKNQRVATGVEGGFVILGQRTSKMTVKQMKELQDFIEWFAAEKGVTFSEPKEAV